jgi:simple sugar transport system ATP-binding protein
MAQAITVTGVSKAFGPTQALSDVSLAIDRGESRALIGKNGAGKSTLMAILTGLLRPDAGTVQVTDEEGGSAFATVGCVYQRSTLIPAATAAENIALARFPTTGLGLIRWNAVRRDAVALLAEWDCGHLADTAVEEMDPLERKIVEICRVLSLGPKVLLLDEPTAGLDMTATERLFRHITKARDRGVSIVYVSHHLQEVFEVCDTVSVLRDGMLVLTAPLSGMGVDDLVAAMVGEAAGADPASSDVPLAARVDTSAPPVLVARSLSSAPSVKRFDLDLRPGECVGLTGLDGSGHLQVAGLLSGQRSADQGTVTLGGAPLPMGDISGCIAAGVGFSPEDRHASGYVPAMTVAENSTMTVMRRFTNRLRLIRTAERDDFYRKLADDWSIKAHGPAQATEELSGGNQQKVVLARSVAASPRVLVLTNPTGGVDVAAKQSIYLTIEDVTRRGQAVVIVTSDDTDLGICDRVLVMFDGEVVATLHPPITESVLAAAVQGTPPGTDEDDHDSEVTAS